MSLEDHFSVFPEQSIPAGYAVLRQGDRCKNYFLLLEGTVKVFTRSSTGKEVVLYHVKPGDLCVLTTTCLLGDQRFPAEAEAITKLKVRAMPNTHFDQLIDSSREFRRYIFDSFSQRMGSLIQTIEQLALVPIEQRLARYLLQQPANQLKTTHQQIAAEVGSVREVISRHLKYFEDEGWLSLHRGSIEVLDRRALHSLI